MFSILRDQIEIVIYIQKAMFYHKFSRRFQNYMYYKSKLIALLFFHEGWIYPKNQSYITIAKLIWEEYDSFVRKER